MKKKHKWENAFRIRDICCHVSVCQIFQGRMLSVLWVSLRHCMWSHVLTVWTPPAVQQQNPSSFHSSETFPKVTWPARNGPRNTRPLDSESYSFPPPKLQLAWTKIFCSFGSILALLRTLWPLNYLLNGVGLPFPLLRGVTWLPTN